MQLTFEDLPRAVSELLEKVNRIEEILLNNSVIQEEIKEENDVMNTKECAEYLKVSVVSIYMFIKRGAIPYYKVGRKKYFKRSEIDKSLKVHL